jgi:RND family efflux transporter MFP subunit
MESDGLAAAQVERVVLDHETRTAHLAAAEVGLREAERRVGDTVLRAPVGGWITDLRIERGEYAQPGRPVVAIQGEGDLEAEIAVPAACAALLEVGQEVQARAVLGSDGPIEAVVLTVARSASMESGLFPVLVQLRAGAHLAAGTSVEIAVPTPVTARWMVPGSAVRSPIGGAAHVMRVRRGRVESVPVVVADVASDSVYVDAPLAAGDRLIVAGHLPLLEGDRVQVVP